MSNRKRNPPIPPRPCANPDCRAMFAPRRITHECCSAQCSDQLRKLSVKTPEQIARRQASRAAFEMRTADAAKPVTSWRDCPDRMPTEASRVGLCAKLLATGCFDARRCGRCWRFFGVGR